MANTKIGSMDTSPRNPAEFVDNRQDIILPDNPELKQKLVRKAVEYRARIESADANKSGSEASRIAYIRKNSYKSLILDKLLEHGNVNYGVISRLVRGNEGQALTLGYLKSLFLLLKTT